MNTILPFLQIFLFAITCLSAASASAFEALPNTPPVPADNLITPAKVELGKKLFFDPRISKSGTISCNSCHNVMGGGEDNRAHSVGVEGKIGGRSSPTVWNAAFQSVQFWDGRAASLEEQAKGPMTNPVEMGMTNHDLVVTRVAQIPGYKEEFTKVFGKDNSINIDNVAKAIATYERTLITANTPYDQFVKGKKNALSASAKRGFELVQSVGCVSCHSGPNFSGPTLPPGQGFYQKFPVIGGTDYEKKYHLTEDQGRFSVTHQESDKNVWRVPTWRNISLTAPYFHNGSVKTLDEAVRVMAKTQLSRDLNNEEVKNIVSFLESLTGKFPDQTMPRLPVTSGMTLLEE